MQCIYLIHGFPKSIISDRDAVFTSHFLQELFRYAGTDLRMSIANHPQTDGQSERVNRCLKTFLRCFTHSCPKRWSHWIPLAQFWYNAVPHSAISMTPFMAMFGHEPRHWGITATSSCSVPALQTWLDERAIIQDLLQQHLQRAHLRMKQQADKKCSERAFEVGDQVFQKLQPYVQTSVAKHANHKLSFKYYGPYSIIAKINPVTYRLEFLANASVHPVFHVSLMFLQFQWRFWPHAGDASAVRWSNKSSSGGLIPRQSATLGKTNKNFKLVSLLQKLGDKPRCKKEGVSRPWAGWSS